LTTTTYLPRKKFKLDRIVPTENDKTFRKQLLHGDVHDQGAAMLGGVSGHAGLFGNANDMAIILQMLLNGGHYGGISYIEKSTIDEFTSMQFPLNDNRRGIGFDKPMIIYEDDGPNCEGASPKSFGHAGFTGTYMWADPQNGLIYVFISNRVHPDAWNNKISEMNIRTRVHQMFYEAIEKSETFAD
jgi:CubicO group peptidase (beta-lactamase class C family)